MRVSCINLERSDRFLKATRISLVAFMIGFSFSANANSFKIQKVNFEQKNYTSKPAGTLFKLNAWGKPIKVDLTENSDNVWQNITRGFSVPELNNSKVNKHEKNLLHNKKALRKSLEAARPYLHYITQECIRRGLPTELALLPFVESKYNPHAISRADAVGLWQFMPTTGAHFKLKQNKWIDERKDLIESTQAALDYLTYLYDLHGTWHLALISYNWGPNAVSRAVREVRNAGKDTVLDNLKLPHETQNYVPKLQAIKNIVSNPSHYDFVLPTINNIPYFAKFKHQKDIDFRELARISNVSLNEIKKLNPGLKQPVMYATQTQHFLIPAKYEHTIKKALEQYKPPKPFRVYKVKSGDTLGHIAAQFNLKVKDIQAINSLGRSTIIKPGMQLTLPNPMVQEKWPT